MQIELQTRQAPSTFFTYASPLLAMFFTLLSGFILFSMLGENAFHTLYVYFVQPILDPWLREQILAKATPLILIALGLLVCFRSNNWNIGAEGQYLLGGIFGAIIPVYFADFNSIFTLPLILIFGAIGGALYAALVAFLKTRFNANEILTSLMLVYVAQQMLDWLVRVLWRDPNGYGFPGTPPFSPSATLPSVFAGGDVHYGFIFALLIALIFWLLLSKTKKGFEINLIGQSVKAARFAGFSVNRMTIFVFLVSGGLAGLAGICEVSGTVGKLDDKLSLGYGFAAIIVAFLGRLNPIGVVVAGLILALSYIGGEEAQIVLGVSDRAVRVFQGLLLFFVLACDSLILYKVRIVFQKKSINLKVAG